MLSISVVRWIEPQTFQSSPRMMQTDAKSFQWLLTCRQKSVMGTEVWPWDSSWEAPRGRSGAWSLRTIEVFQWPSRKNIPGRVGWDVWKGLESRWRCVCVCVCVCACMCAQSCPTLCEPMDSSPPDSSVYGIVQARILEWVAISSSRACSQPRKWTCVYCVSYTSRQILYQ